jgi:hypothetical protein
MPIKITGPASRPGFDKEQHEDHLCLFIHPASEMMETSFGESEVAKCAYEGARAPAGRR